MSIVFADAIPGLTDLWDETRGDPGICIAVLDGPVDLSHPSLATANLTQLETLVSHTPQRVALEHGTHIASVIFGQHGSSISGLAPNCRGVILPIFSDGTDGSIAPCSQLDLARAMTQAVEQGAHIINISGGELSPSGMAHPILADAVKECAEQGVLIVAAAGNQGCDCLNIPGALPSVLAVGAMDAQGMPLEFSNWGEIYETQGILALGEDIPGAGADGGVVAHSGTSYATPMVSGVAALLLSLQLKYGQKPDPLAVRAAILRSAITCEDEPAPNCRRLLAGRINVKGAKALVLEGGIPEMSDNQEPLGVNAAHTVTPADTVQAVEITQVPMSQPATVAQIVPADCGCGQKGGEGCTCGKATQGQLVFALGTLSYDFGTSANRDSIQQEMGAAANPDDYAQFLDYLETNPWVAANVNWILNLETTPIYCIVPQGAFAREVYELLRQFLGDKRTEHAERMSLPGVIIGQCRLMSGQIVPAVAPEIRCMYDWTTAALVAAVAGSPPDDNAKPKEKSDYAAKVEGVTNFLNRINFEFRTLGLLSPQRALNAFGVYLARTTEIFASAVNAGMELDRIEVEPSPICPPGSDCWDVKLVFFDPENVLRSKRVYRSTVDVSDVCPRVVGEVRSWSER